jgi:TatA/E family protein of Tat protein translocase
MFGIGMPEFILIAVVALIVFGPKKLPELAKSMGRAMREFRKATSELKETMQVDSELSEVKKAFTELQSEVTASVNKEAAGPESPAAPLPAPDPAPGTSPADAAAEPSSAEKLEELKKAFDAWSAAKPDTAESGGPPPQTSKPA